MCIVLWEKNLTWIPTKEINKQHLRNGKHGHIYVIKHLQMAWWEQDKKITEGRIDVK